MFLDCLIFLSENWQTSDKTFLIWKPGNNRYCTGLCFYSIIGKPLFHFIYLWWLTFNNTILCVLSFPGSASGKELGCQFRRHKRRGFDPWVGKIPWRKAWQVFQYSGLENPMDRGAWWATVQRVAKSQTWLKKLSIPTHTHARTHTHTCKFSTWEALHVEYSR